MLSRWCLLGFGSVDPRGLGQGEDLGVGGGGEPLGVSGSGVGQDLAAGHALGCGEAVVDIGGGVQADAAVVVLVVVGLHELVHEVPGVLDRAESLREDRGVLQR